MNGPSRTLKLPEVEPVQYERNFITTAVCELRFPTLLEFETSPPVQLQKELRKDYPYYEPTQAVDVAPNTVEREVRYLFKSRKRDWIVSFKSYAIALETTRYTSFDDFFARFQRLLTISQPLLDTDFYTRVGLRYIDEITIKEGSPSGWIRDDIITPLIQGVYGDVGKYIQEVRGFTDSGQYTFRHGISTPNIYRLDFDFYEENVQHDQVFPLIEQFNQIGFRFFHWVLGKKAFEHLGKVTSKQGERKK